MKAQLVPVNTSERKNKGEDGVAVEFLVPESWEEGVEKYGDKFLPMANRALVIQFQSGLRKRLEAADKAGKVLSDQDLADYASNWQPQARGAKKSVADKAETMFATMSPEEQDALVKRLKAIQSGKA